MPSKSVLGRYSIEPSRFTTTVPLAGFVTTLGVVAPLGVSLPNTFTTTGVLIAVVERSSTAIGNTGVVLVVVPLTVTTMLAVLHTVGLATAQIV